MLIGTIQWREEKNNRRTGEGRIARVILEQMRGDGLVLNESTGSSPGSPEGGSSRHSTVDRVVLGIWKFYADLLFFPRNQEERTSALRGAGGESAKGLRAKNLKWCSRRLGKDMHWGIGALKMVLKSMQGPRYAEPKGVSYKYLQRPNEKQNPVQGV